MRKSERIPESAAISNPKSVLSMVHAHCVLGVHTQRGYNDCGKEENCHEDRADDQ